MQTEILKIDPANPDKAKIKKAAEIIDSGGLVAFPTETVYGIASRVSDDSLARLGNLKNRTPDKHYTLHIGRKSDLAEYLPPFGLSTQKLIKNTWPGPLTIVFELSPAEIENLKNALPSQVFDNLYKNNSIGIRCPSDPIASLLLSSAESPVVAPSANISGRAPAVNADEVLSHFKDQIELLIDGGTCKYKKSSTVIRIGRKPMEILREGVLSREKLQQYRMVTFLLVCTGNTCRSPMAEAFFRKYLAEKLQCGLDLLDQFGYKVRSAGTMGIASLPPSDGSITACAQRGIDIRNHRSSAISEDLIRQSDFIYVMSQSHRELVIAMNPEAANKCILLAENENIPDPIGQSQQFYNDCADKIEMAVKKRISELMI